jgi:hypothetical protein
MGYTGLISFSLNSKVIPDLAFFDLILTNNYLLIISIIVLALALTLSTIDTLINAISSILIVNGSKISKSIFGNSIKNKTNYIIILISILVFILASKGYSILYLFLLADLFCCAAVVTIFMDFLIRKLILNYPICLSLVHFFQEYYFFQVWIFNQVY